MMKFTSVPLALALAALASAQIAPAYPASIQNGASNRDDEATAVAYDASGNTYVTGTSQYTLGGGFRTAVWTMKLDKSGSVVWSHYGRAGLLGENDFAKGIAVDGLGNTYVAAEANRTAASSSMLLIKYDTAGNIQWARLFNPAAGHHNIPVGVGVDSLNRAYIAGTAGDGAGQDYVVSQFSGGSIQNWIQKFDLSGQADQCTAMKIMPNGDSYLAGSSQPASGMGAVTSWIVKYNASGVKQWDNGITNDTAVIYQTSAVDVFADGTVCIAGSSFPVDTELFAAKFTKAGVYEWTRTYDPVSSLGFPTNIGGFGVGFGSDGSVFATGAIQVNSSYVQGIFVKWDKTGVFKFAKPFGNASNQTCGIAMKVDRFNRAVIAYQSSVGSASYRQAGVVVFDGNTGTGVGSILNGTSSNLNKASGLAVDGRGQIYFAGTSKLVPNSANFLIQKFVQSIVCLNHGYSVAQNGTLTVGPSLGVMNNARYVVDGVISLVTGPSHGSLNLNADGSFQYTPTSGFTGTDSFTFRGVQSGMNGNVATATIAVTP